MSRELCIRRGLQQLLLLPSREAPDPAHAGTSGTGSSGDSEPAWPTSLSLGKHKAPVLPLRGLLCSFQSCFICYKMGASITCCQTGCDRTFHLPCAPDGQCVTQYFGAYR